MLVVTLIAVVILILASIWNAREITGPLQHMMVLCNRLSKGDFRITPRTVNRGDEFGEMADVLSDMDFEKDYPDARTIKLEQNYRSTKNILAAANAVIENNRNRKPKELWTENAEGEKITSYLANDERDEANFIATTITKQKTIFNASYGDMAILYRTNAQSRILEEGFMKVTEKDMENVAVLSRLSIPEGEKGKYTQQLNEFLDYVDNLSGVPTENIQPMAHGAAVLLEKPAELLEKVDFVGKK